jgi:hypothetical protein
MTKVICGLDAMSPKQVTAGRSHQHLILTSAADWPVAPAARAMLRPFSFTRRITQA